MSPLPPYCVYFKYVFLKTWQASLLPYEDSFIYCYESMIELFLKELLPFFAIRIFHQKVVHASPLTFYIEFLKLDHVTDPWLSSMSH
jgi:hypothetical protein